MTESGLKLDINRLCRNGFIRPGSYTESSMRWSDSYSARNARGVIKADMRDPSNWIWFRIQIDDEQIQHIALEARERRFGGHQWYFLCPRTGTRASVLWMPPGAQSFASRKRWGRQVAYHSQFLSWIDRAHLGKSRINRRLCAAGSFDPSDWEFPPKPKWMRWPTYHRAEEKFDRYEAALDRAPWNWRPSSLLTHENQVGEQISI